MPANHTEIEKKLWEAADNLRANSGLKSHEYSTPVLGLIFLRFADFKFTQAKKDLESKIQASGGRRTITNADYQAKGVLALPENARFQYLLNLPEEIDVGKEINEAMKAIEKKNDELKDTLPKNYNVIEKDTLVALLKTFSDIPMDLEGDIFGKIYEYFLSKFAMSEGQRGGEFFTPISLVKLIVEIIEPYHGRILDPACGSGGMFVQSAKFVQNHKKKPNEEIAVYGQEKADETVRLCKMNLAVHGLSGDIKPDNTYYENAHDCRGRFDFVMANPPFNVNGVDKEKIIDDPRYPFGMPTVDNANYIWIQEFYSALNEHGRAGFVMANSATDARGSELEIRKKIIENNTVDVVISIGSNFFYTVTLPCTLWFFDKGKKNDYRNDKVLFIDARIIFTQIDRAHREFTPQQIEFIANIVRLYRHNQIEKYHNSDIILNEKFPLCKYEDVPGLCKVADMAEIEAQGWSLTPGRYVGVPDQIDIDYNFKSKLQILNEKLEYLNTEAKIIESKINDNINEMLKN
jgi:type I restriction enzyme M protein